MSSTFGNPSPPFSVIIHPITFLPSDFDANEAQTTKIMYAILQLLSGTETTLANCCSTVSRVTWASLLDTPLQCFDADGLVIEEYRVSSILWKPAAAVPRCSHLGAQSTCSYCGKICPVKQEPEMAVSWHDTEMTLLARYMAISTIVFCLA